MSGRRHRGEDEFDDERPWPAGGQPGGYHPAEDAGPEDRPRGQDAPGYVTGRGDLPPGPRRGRHSAPSGLPSMPADPYSRSARRERHAPPPEGPPDSGPLARVPRQPGQDRYGSRPEQYGAPAARYPGPGGGYPGDSPRSAGEAGRRPASSDEYPPPGEPHPSSGGRRSWPAAPYPTPDDPYAAPGDRYAGSGDRHPGGRDSHYPATGSYPESRGVSPPRTAYPDPEDRGPWSRGRADEFGGAYPQPRDQRSHSGDGYPPARGQRPEPNGGYPRARPPAPAGRRPGSGDEYPAAAGDRYRGAGDDYDAPGDYGAGNGYGARDGYGSRDDSGTGGGREAEDDYDFWDDSGIRGDRGTRGGREVTGERGRGGFGDDADDRPGRPKRRRRGRWAGALAVLGILAIVVPLAVGGFYAYRVISAHFFPADYSGAGTGQVIVEIRPGDTATAVGDRLFALGVVASARAFVNAAEHSQKSSALEPGFYRLHRHMNATLAFNMLLKPSSRVQLKVTIPEGLRETQITAALAHGSRIPLSDYKQALRSTAALGLPSYAHGDPEGYLFPATYEIQPGMTATSVLQAMVKAFNQEAAGVHLAKVAARGHLTPQQAIVVASLAQAEGGKVSDFPKITRVIYNRLTAGMPLQLDSTVLYALHKYGILASAQQLNVRSPYNTYKHKGLPPGPIDSPGDAAIRAALHPAQGNWLYFVTVNPKTRKTVFTSSSAVFNQLRAELQHNLGGG